MPAHFMSGMTSDMAVCKHRKEKKSFIFCLCGAMSSASAWTRLIRWVTYSCPACFIMGRHIGPGMEAYTDIRPLTRLDPWPRLDLDLRLIHDYNFDLQPTRTFTKWQQGKTLVYFTLWYWISYFDQAALPQHTTHSS